MHRLGVIFRKFIQRPFLRRRAQIGMISIEALDELLAVNILLVGWAAVPKMRMPVDDEYLFTVSSPVHSDFSLSRHAGDLASSRPDRLSGLRRKGANAGAGFQQSVFNIG